MLARPRAIRRSSFLPGIATGLAVSAACACSGGAFSFTPSADGAPSTSPDTMADVATTPDVVGTQPDVVSTQSVKDAAHDDRVIIDVSVAPMRDAGPSDTTSPPMDSSASDALPPLPSTGMLLWLSADVDVSDDSGHVATWRDRSGNGNDARQMDEALRPAIEPTWRGNQPAVLFDGISAFLGLPESFHDFTAGLSLFVVGDVSDNSNCPSFVHFSNGGENDDISLHCENNDTFTYEVQDEYLVSSTNAAPVNQPLLLGIVQQPTQEVTLFSGGTSSGQSTMMLPADVHRAVNDIGRSSYTDCGLLSGHVAEIILYGRAVDNAERTAIEDYLRAKWAL